MDLVDQLKRRAEEGRWIDTPAFSEEGRTTVLTHAQVFDAAESLAAVLAGQGILEGEAVALLLGDRLEWPVAFLACARARAVAVLVNPDASLATLEELYQLGEVSLLLVHDEDRTKLVDRRSGVVRAEWSLERALEEGPPSVHLSGAPLDSPLYLQFSSGTSGHHKAVRHRGEHLELFHRSVGESALALGPDDVLYSVSQLYFTYGFNNQFVYPLFSGGSAILRPERRRPEEIATAINELSPTVLFSVPSSLALTADAVRRHGGTSSQLRAIVSAGEKLPAFVEEAVESELGAPVLEQIGCTEVGNAICANRLANRSIHSCGTPCPGIDVEVRPPWDEEAAISADPIFKDVGDLWVRSATIPATARTVNGDIRLTDAEGWLRTGDLARWNYEGALVVLGRSDDMLMSGGISVSALRIEQTIRASGLVIDTALASIVGKDGKSFLVALVVPATAERWDGLTVLLNAHCRKNLDRYCIPNVLLEANEVPRTPSGKIRRHLVAERAGVLLEMQKGSEDR
ncbi:class I adenylate-forming enzyme family protein [Leucobacter sp. M11]|uniref:class I adenylate-forming enzyme family protein n=1 Tax=Leucobacter sp. M11 TaxID=2993565 RepID=UPI002D7EDA18|nr:AMP-binding protein [Leucobacter sp. M11]MEB4613733.1 AMP-binding protein [Leucobacter sp. M11]